MGIQRDLMVLFLVAAVAVSHARPEPPLGGGYGHDDHQGDFGGDGDGYGDQDSHHAAGMTTYRTRSDPSERYGGNFGSKSSSARFGASPHQSHNGHRQPFEGGSNGLSEQNYGHGEPQNYDQPSGGHHGPAQEYGAPNGQDFGEPSPSYGAPNGHEMPQKFNNNNHGGPGLSQKYGAPKRRQSAHSQKQHGSLSQSYGAPTPRRNYGAPMGDNAHAKQRFQGAPMSDSYSRRAGPSDGHQGGYGDGGYGGNQQDDMSEDPMYSFSYEVQDDEHGAQFGQSEEREDSVTRGHYHVLLPDGRLQKVEYEADERGYRPTISFEDTRENQDGPY